MWLRGLLSCSAVVLVGVQGVAQAPLGRVVPGRLLVSYRSGAIPASAAEVATGAGGRMVARNERLGIAVVQAAAGSEESARRQLAADPNVEFVVADRVVMGHQVVVRAAGLGGAVGQGTGADALYYGAGGWAVRQVGGFGDAATVADGTPGPWTRTQGAGVRIAILDSGVDANHPDIAPHLRLNLSEVDQSAATGMPSVCDDGSAQDQEGHGTWVASLAAGAMGAGTGMTVGVAPAATILNIKVLERLQGQATARDPSGCQSGQASGLASWVLAGIDDAVANGADVISLSLGTLVDVTTGDGAGLETLFNRATHAAAMAGVVVIAAAGNDGFDVSSGRYVELPAQSRDVLAMVAASNPDCSENLIVGAGCVAGPVTLPYYSNFGGPMNALAAPGGSYPESTDQAATSGWIWGACSQGKTGTLDGAPVDAAHSLGCFGLGHQGYVQAMGTSASAPLAAGAAALVRAAHPEWSAAMVMAALRSSAVTTGTLPVAEVNVAGMLTPVAAISHHIDVGGKR